MASVGNFQEEKAKLITSSPATNSLTGREDPNGISTEELVTLTVHRVLTELGFKAGQSNRVKRADMVRVIGRRRFDRAVQDGELRIHKNGSAQTAGVWASREDWERFVKRHHL